MTAQTDPQERPEIRETVSVAGQLYNEAEFQALNRLVLRLVITFVVFVIITTICFVVIIIDALSAGTC